MKKYIVKWENIKVGTYLVFFKDYKHYIPNQNSINDLKNENINLPKWLIEEYKGTSLIALDNRIQDTYRFNQDQTIDYHNDSITIEETINIDFIIEDNRIYSLNKTDDVIAEITYENISDNTININRTFVDESLRGNGIAAILVELAVYINKDKQIIASCSYADNWLKQNM